MICFLLHINELGAEHPVDKYTKYGRGGGGRRTFEYI